uniref:Uncharacterized protein n=1 Tax=Echinococcus granulosus TaxID=6210 RepID=A0A068WQC2_ECHGR|nr:hypothetical protein EgrG_000350700 [Echinococcus granulosus]
MVILFIQGFQLDRRKRRCHGGIQTDNFLKKEKAIDASEAAHTKCSSKMVPAFAGNARRATCPHSLTPQGRNVYKPLSF